MPKAIVCSELSTALYSTATSHKTKTAKPCVKCRFVHKYEETYNNSFISQLGETDRKWKRLLAWLRRPFLYSCLTPSLFFFFLLQVSSSVSPLAFNYPSLPDVLVTSHEPGRAIFACWELLITHRCTLHSTNVSVATSCFISLLTVLLKESLH